MPAKLDLDIDKIVTAYEEEGSLRGAAERLSKGRETKIGHMVIKKHLLAEGFGYLLHRDEGSPQSMAPMYKVYIRPEQFEALDRLAARRNESITDERKKVNRHSIARDLLDDALRKVLKGWVVDQPVHARLR